MDNYQWQKNKAIVDRMYYSERVLQISTTFASLFTAIDLMFLKSNYMVAAAKRRIPRYWLGWGVFNAVTIFLLLKPLKQSEMRIQWRKRKLMGKWLYSLYHLEEE